MSLDVFRLLLMAPLEFFLGKATYCAMKTDKVRVYFSCKYHQIKMLAIDNLIFIKINMTQKDKDDLNPNMKTTYRPKKNGHKGEPHTATYSALWYFFIHI